jgi:hypothetical protein
MSWAETIRCTLSGVLATGVVRIEQSSPMAKAFARDTSKIPSAVLVRHALEHVFRIRMFRPLDMVAARYLEETDGQTAGIWARYSRSEAVHDRYFLRDLKGMGLERSEVELHQPFGATVRLGKFLDSAATEFGPTPIVLYSFWAEENSDVGSAPIIHVTRQRFGAESARGAYSHRALDENLDHVKVISQVLAAIIRNDHELLLATRLLDIITEFLLDYFSELDGWQRDYPSDDRSRAVPEAHGFTARL